MQADEDILFVKLKYGITGITFEQLSPLLSDEQDALALKRWVLDIMVSKRFYVLTTLINNTTDFLYNENNLFNYNENIVYAFSYDTIRLKEELRYICTVDIHKKWHNEYLNLLYKHLSKVNS